MVGATILVKKYMCVYSPYKGRETQKPYYVYNMIWWLGLARDGEKLYMVVFLVSLGVMLL